MLFLNIALYVVIFFLGASVGSFSLVILRRSRDPNAGSWITGHSYCETCRHELKWYELIPFFSYLCLGGKCLKCKTKIPPSHFFCETGLGLIYISLWHLYQIGKFGSVDNFGEMTKLASPNGLIPDGFLPLIGLLVYIVICSIMWIMSVSDFLYREVNVMPVYAMAVVAIAWKMLVDWHNWPYLAAAVVFFILLEILGAKDDNPLFGVGDLYVVVAIIVLVCDVLAVVDILAYAAAAGILMFLLFLRKSEDPIPFVPCLFIGLVLDRLGLSWTNALMNLVQSAFKL